MGRWASIFFLIERRLRRGQWLPHASSVPSYLLRVCVFACVLACVFACVLACVGVGVGNTTPAPAALQAPQEPSEQPEQPGSWLLQPNLSFLTGQAQEGARAPRVRRQSEGFEAGLSLRLRWLHASLSWRRLRELRESIPEPTSPLLRDAPDAALEEQSMVPGIAPPQPSALPLGERRRDAVAFTLGGGSDRAWLRLGALYRWGEGGSRWAPAGALELPLGSEFFSFRGAYQLPETGAPGVDRAGLQLRLGRGRLWAGWTRAEAAREGIGVAGQLPLSASLYLLLGGALNPLYRGRYTRIVVGLRWSGERARPEEEELPLITPAGAQPARPGADPFRRLTPSAPGGAPGGAPSAPGSPGQPLSPLSPGSRPGAPGPAGPPL